MTLQSTEPPCQGLGLGWMFWADIGVIWIVYGAAVQAGFFMGGMQAVEFAVLAPVQLGHQICGIALITSPL